MKEPRYAWVVVWAAFVCLAVIFGVSYSFAAFFDSFATEFDAQRADVALVFGLSGLIYFLLGAGGGMLADRFGPRAVTVAGMACIALGLAGASAARSLTMIYATYGVGIGVGIALVYTPAIACVQPWFRQRRGLAAGIASAGIGAGTVAVPLLATAAIAMLDWRSALRVLAIGVLIVGIGAAWLLRRAPVADNSTAGSTAGSIAGSTASSMAGHPGGERLADALRDRRFWWLYAAVVLAAPGMFIPFAHVSAAARDLGIDSARAVGLVGMVGIGSLIGRFAIGALADRIGRLLTLTIVQASMGLSFVLWWAAGAYPALAVFALWFGISYGGIVSLLPAICMDLFGARAVASILGTLYTGAAAGNLLGPVAAGAVFDHAGSYAPVMWGCLALSGIAALASARLLGLRGSIY